MADICCGSQRLHVKYVLCKKSKIFDEKNSVGHHPIFFFVNALKIVNTFTVGSEIETERRPVKTMAILKKTLNLKPLLFQITEHETQSSWVQGLWNINESFEKSPKIHRNITWILSDIQSYNGNSIYECLWWFLYPVQVEGPYTQGLFLKPQCWWLNLEKWEISIKRK